MLKAKKKKKAHDASVKWGIHVLRFYKGASLQYLHYSVPSNRSCNIKMRCDRWPIKNLRCETTKVLLAVHCTVSRQLCRWYIIPVVYCKRRLLPYAFLIFLTTFETSTELLFVFYNDGPESCACCGPLRRPARPKQQCKDDVCFTYYFCSCSCFPPPRAGSHRPRKKKVDYTADVRSICRPFER